MVNSMHYQHDLIPKVHSPIKVVKIFEPRLFFLWKEYIYQVWDAFFLVSRPSGPLPPLNAMGSDKLVDGDFQRGFTTTIYLSLLLPMLPCPDDITPIRPFGATWCARLSTTRMRLSEFVTITCTKSSVDTSPIVWLGHDLWFQRSQKGYRIYCPASAYRAPWFNQVGKCPRS